MAPNHAQTVHVDRHTLRRTWWSYLCVALTQLAWMGTAFIGLSSIILTATLYPTATACCTCIMAILIAFCLACQHLWFTIYGVRTSFLHCMYNVTALILVVLSCCGTTCRISACCWESWKPPPRTKMRAHQHEKLAVRKRRALCLPHLIVLLLICTCFWPGIAIPALRLQLFHNPTVPVSFATPLHQASPHFTPPPDRDSTAHPYPPTADPVAKNHAQPTPPDILHQMCGGPPPPTNPTPISNPVPGMPAPAARPPQTAPPRAIPTNPIDLACLTPQACVTAHVTLSFMAASVLTPVLDRLQLCDQIRTHILSNLTAPWLEPTVRPAGTYNTLTRWSVSIPFDGVTPAAVQHWHSALCLSFGGIFISDPSCDSPLLAHLSTAALLHLKPARTHISNLFSGTASDWLHVLQCIPHSLTVHWIGFMTGNRSVCNRHQVTDARIHTTLPDLPFPCDVGVPANTLVILADVPPSAINRMYSWHHPNFGTFSYDLMRLPLS